MPPTIEITIAEDGEVKIEVKGAKGNECLTLTEFLEKGLGEVAGRTMKSDFYEEKWQTVQTTEVKRKP